MFILPVKIDENGAIMVDGDVPSDAVCTVMDATGCSVYMLGDELPIYPIYNNEEQVNEEQVADVAAPVL